MHLLKNKILQSSAINVFFSGGTNVLNYIFVLMCVYYLTPREYGDLALIISFYSIISIFATTLATISLSILSRENDKEHNRAEKVKIMNVAKVLILSLSLMSIFILTPLIYHFFDIDSYLNIAIILITGVIAVVTSLLTVHFQVMEEFTRNGYAQVTGTVFKLSLSFIALYLSYGLLGISLSLFLSTIFTFIIFYPKEEYTLLLERKVSNIFKVSLQFYKDNKSLILKSLLSSLITILCITADTLLAKKLLSEDMSAQFIGMSVVSKLFIYGMLAITTVIFPYILKVKEVQKLYITYLNIFIIITGTIWVALAYFFGEFLLQLILGSKYISMSQYFYLTSLIAVTATLAYTNSHLASLLDAKRLNFTYITSLAFAMMFFAIINPNNFVNLSIYISLVFAFISFMLYYVNIRNSANKNNNEYEANKYNSPLL